MAIDLEQRRIDQELSGIKQELAHLRGVVEQHDLRFQELRQEFREGFQGLRAEQQRVGDKIDTTFRWTLGILLPLILGLYAAILLRR